jgi:transcriptional antiterminator
MARQSVPNQNHGVTSRTPKYEIAQINDIALTVDVSLLAKTDEMFFNATEMAKQFGKRPDDFWKQEQNREYLAALVTP